MQNNNEIQQPINVQNSEIPLEYKSQDEKAFVQKETQEPVLVNEIYFENGSNCIRGETKFQLLL